MTEEKPLIVQVWFDGPPNPETKAVFSIIETQFVDFEDFEAAVEYDALIYGQELRTRPTDSQNTRVLTSRYPTLFRGSAVMRARPALWKIVTAPAAPAVTH